MLDKIKKLLYHSCPSVCKIKIEQVHKTAQGRSIDMNRNPNHPAALLTVEHIEKYYGSQSAVTKALDDVSFQVQRGEYISIMGASGSGKTTLLNCISTIDTVSAGHILLDGKDITTINDNDIAAFRPKKLMRVCTKSQKNYRYMILCKSFLFRSQADRNSVVPLHAQ